jgi:hypothetical protein
MSYSYEVCKAAEPALIAAFAKSNFRPAVEEVTHSDLYTGGMMYPACCKVTFTAKKGPYVKTFMYLPLSTVGEQHYLSQDEKTVLEAWIKSVAINNPVTSEGVY